MFEDDIKFFKEVNADKGQQNMQKGIDRLVQRYDLNEMQLSLNKCKFICSTRNINKQLYFPYEINGTALSEVIKEKRCQCHF